MGGSISRKRSSEPTASVGRNLLGVGGDAQAALVVERTQRAEPAVHGLGETEEALGVVGETQGRPA